jgi:hypothetical protein
VSRDVTILNVHATLQDVTHNTKKLVVVLQNFSLGIGPRKCHNFNFKMGPMKCDAVLSCTELEYRDGEWELFHEHVDGSALRPRYQHFETDYTVGPELKTSLSRCARCCGCRAMNFKHVSYRNACAATVI